MAADDRQIRLQARPSVGKPEDKTPMDAARRMLRGAMVVGKPEPLPPDHLFPNLWSATAYDSFKYSSHLKKLAMGLLHRLAEGAGRVAGAPIHAAMAVSRRAGRPMDEILQDPGTLHELVSAFTRPESSGRGEFLPHGYQHSHPEHPGTRHHRKGASMTSKAQFIRAHMDEFREKQAQVHKEVEASICGEPEPVEKTAGLIGDMSHQVGLRLGLSQPNAVDHLVGAFKGVGNLGGHLGALADKAHSFAKEHPVGLGLGLAGLAGAGYGLHRMHQQSQQIPRHHQAFHEAMQIFPELQSEDPRKMQLLHSSAVQVAPHMSTNPLLLGTWMKGLAKGFSGTHLSTEDLKRLQDLEVQHVGKPENRPSSGLGTLAAAAGAGASLASIYGHLRKGQGS